MSFTFSVEVSYGQLAVFASVLEQPFNDWTDRHFAQGFSWRPGSVSFRTIQEEGPHTIEVRVVDHADEVSSDAVRVIEVPFNVPADGAIEIGSITDTRQIEVLPGLFLLRCEFLASDGSSDQHVRLTFSKEDKAKFSIVRADAELSIEGDLVTIAEPASG